MKNQLSSTASDSLFRKLIRPKFIIPAAAAVVIVVIAGIVFLAGSPNNKN